MLHSNFKWSAISERRNDLTARYEPVQPQFLLQLAEFHENFIFLDIGANIGYYSIILANHANVSAVLAFEPNPHCVAELTENLQLNNLASKVKIHDFALSDWQGIAQLALTSKLGGDSALTETRFHSTTPKYTHDVRVFRLDEIIQFAGVNLIIKMDIEGHEYQALKGAIKTLTDNRGFLQIEILPENPQKNDILDFLKIAGWDKFISIGPDYYFTNITHLKSESERLAVIERFLAAIVQESLHGVRPGRIALMRGATLEISRHNVEVLKTIFRAPFLRFFRGK